MDAHQNLPPLLRASHADRQMDIERRIEAEWEKLIAPDAPFATEEALVLGQQMQVFASAPRNLTEIWASTSTLNERPYLIFETDRISYRAAHATVKGVAGWLHERGIGPGDRVGIAMRNYPEWMLVYWATLWVGASVVGINAWWAAEELTFAMDDCRPKVLFCDSERYGLLDSWAERTAGTDIVLVRCDRRPGALAWEDVTGTIGDVAPHDAAPDDEACIFYTSGTTGRAKGARLTHRGCINTVMGIGFATELAKALGDGASVTAEFPVSLATTPLFHVTANNCLALPTTAAGGTLVLMRKWDAHEALRLVEAERVTALSGVPTMARELLAHAAGTGRDLSSLSILNGGGAPVPPDLVVQIGTNSAPMRPGTGFGMTETSGLVSAISGAAYVAKPTSCGRPIPTFETRIVDESGTPLPVGMVGELCVRGPGVIDGYLNAPEETAAALTDGWLSTGDLAYLDALGYIFIVDRKKDMVLRGGENVYCAEVEAALYRHPAVAEACVFGVPDERLGEEVGAAVWLQGSDIPTAETLRAHVRELLAAFKVPRHIWIVTQPLPRNATGKIQRKQLRAELLASADSSEG